MSKDEAVNFFKKIDQPIHKLVLWLCLGMLSFLTYIGDKAYGQWQDHEKTDRNTELVVTRHDAEIKQNAAQITEVGTQLNFLTGRVETISDRINRPNNP